MEFAFSWAMGREWKTFPSCTPLTVLKNTSPRHNGLSRWSASTRISEIVRFGGGRWASLEANFFRGGRSTIDGERRDDEQRNSNVGASVLFPLGKRQSLRLAINTALVTRSGGDYQTVLLNYIRLLK
jgi:hypothetical protein